MPALLERPKMTRAMYEALKRHIMHEREKKKQAEQEQDAMMERLKKERELRKRKEEQDSSTLEQTSEQISHLKDKLELLKKQKSELFSQLKRVLHHEDETRRRAQQKEQSELTVTQQAPYQHTTHGAVPQPMVMHGGRPALYKPTASAAMQSGLKRQRSPSPTPTPASSYQSYSHNEAKYPHTLDSKYPHIDPKYPSHIDPKFVHSDPKYLTSYGATKPMQSSHPSLAQPVDYKSSVYPPTGTSHLYGANPNFQQQATTVAGSYSSGSKYVSTGQSAFTSYQSQFAQSHPQKALADQFSSAYPIQRMQQPGYHTGIQLQQPLDNPVATKQPGFEEKYKLGPGQIRGMGPSQQQTQMTQAMQLQQQQQQQQQVKTAAPFAQSYQARPPATPSGSAYPTSTAGSNTFTRHSISQGRPGYGSQTHNRYF